MRYAVVHEGTPIGIVELPAGELVAGALSPSSAFEALRPTLHAGSAALLTLGFFGAATAEGPNGGGTALRAAAALRFDLIDLRGELAPTTFVNVIEAPDGGLVVLACFGHAHAAIPAVRTPAPVSGTEEAKPGSGEPDV